MRLRTLVICALVLWAGCHGTGADVPPDSADTDVSSADTSGLGEDAVGVDVRVADAATADAPVEQYDAHYGPAESDGLLQPPPNGTCVPHGERFVDTYECNGVGGPSGNPALPTSVVIAPSNPETLTDLDLEWSRMQIEACSCVCCHGYPSASTFGPTGEGRHVWNGRFAPAWTDSVSDRRLEKLGGLTPTPGITIPPEENHGFSRADSALPTQDAERLRAFVQRELDRR